MPATQLLTPPSKFLRSVVEQLKAVELMWRARSSFLYEGPNKTGSGRVQVVTVKKHSLRLGVLLSTIELTLRTV